MPKYSLQAQGWALITAFSNINKPYIWGGDDPSGFDCSGFVLECLKSAGVVTEGFDTTADGLLKRFSEHKIASPEKGALLFYLRPNGTARHVVICCDDKYQIGASGGDDDNLTEDKAWIDNAYVKVRPINFNPDTMVVVQIWE
jgi:cell wall-associated NlpC family hydrolase